MSYKPLVGPLVEPFSQGRLKMAKINYFSNEMQLSLNNILSEIFEILGVDYQMSTSIGQDEPHRSPKKAYFSLHAYDSPNFYFLRNLSVFMLHV